MTVTEPFNVLSLAPSELGYTPIEYKRYAEAYADNVLGNVAAAASSASFACDVLHVEHEQVYQAIIDAAEARRCDLIVMASHGRRGVSAVPRQSDGQSAHALEDPRTRVSLRAPSAVLMNGFAV